MNFSKDISVNNKSQFKLLKKELCISKLYKDIEEHIIINEDDENNYFSIDTWARENNIKINLVQDMLNEKIIPELQNNGWKCKKSFGDTALFIYSTEYPPPSCYETGF